MKVLKSKGARHAMALGIAMVASTSSQTAVAGYAFEGQGISNVLSGSVASGGLFWGTIPTWLNVSPSLPYTNQVAFALPACDRVVVSRLVMTVWGGTADYTCQMTVSVNGTNLPVASPFVFGTTADMNAVFNADAPCAYGSGYGVWLVTLPVPGNMLFKDGSSNIVQVAETTPDGFDGRIQHVTLVVAYQSSSLTNTLDYALAEGSGDIRGAPTPPQVDQRTVVFGTVNPTNATAATLTALYTYARTGQNDELFINGTQLGGDDVAQWDTSVANYGPSVVSFDVLASLGATNTVKFDVSAADVPDPREAALRPQVALLTVTLPGAPLPPTLSIGLQTNAVELTLTGETGRSYTVESTTSLTGTWAEFTNFVSVNAVTRFLLPPTNGCIFFRAQTP